MASFLDLVNGVIRESGIQDEPLTAGTFALAENVDPMYGKVKRWVQQAWHDVQMERLDYKWQTGSAIVLLHPRIKFYNAIDLGGGTFQGNAVTSESDFEFALSAPIYTDSPTNETGYANILATPTLADTLGDDNPLTDASLRFGEAIFFPDTTAPNSSYRFFGWGEYNFTDQNEPLDSDLTDIAEVHQNTIRILSDTGNTSDEFPIPYIPYTDWRNKLSQWNFEPGMPQYYTQNLQGKFLFGPGLDRPYRVKFTYTKRPHQMQAYNDIPVGLEVSLHDTIMWRALEKYGMYDQRPMAIQRARDELNKYKRWQERDVAVAAFNPRACW